MDNEIRVAMMSRAFADRDRAGSNPEECFGSCSNDLRIRVDWLPGDCFNEVRFEQHGLSTEIEIKQPKALEDQLVKSVPVTVGV
jgi:hypothetical protein